jgi:hypothetical protein
MANLKTVTLLLMILAFQPPACALAAFCGSPSDTSEIESLALARGPSDSARIMDIVVVRNYGRIDFDFKGRLTEYYVKHNGNWKFSGNAVPTDATSAVQSQLTNFVPRDNGGVRCQNPNFVNPPSGK